MRQIKFRVWDKTRRIFLHHSRNTIDSQNLWLSLEGSLTSVTRPNHEIENFIIQQFTGLKDINGVDIYEGDIVEWQNLYSKESNTWLKYREPVTFDRGVFWVDLPLGLAIVQQMVLYEVNEVCEIVGNINDR